MDFIHTACLDEAAQALHQSAAGTPGLVVCCGSVFVAAEMRETLATLRPSHFAPDDWVFERAAEPALLM